MRNVKKSWILLFLFVLFSAAYYYGLHLSFWPDAEALGMTQKYYWRDEFGYQLFKNPRHLAEILAYISYKIFGAGYTGIRIWHTLMYFVALSITSVLALYVVRDKKVNWYLLPLFGFLTVILNPGSSELCGFHCPLYHVYPYDMHQESLIAALCGMFLLELIFQVYMTKRKKVTATVVLISLIVCRRTDLLFIVGFVAPMLCIGTLYLWKTRRKLFINLLLIILSAIVLLRFFSIFYEPIRGLFIVRELGYGNWTRGGIYGNTGFIEYTKIWQNINNTLTELMALYNAQFSGLNILSINTLIGFIRVVTLILILVIALYYIIVAFRKDIKLDTISLCMSFAIFLNIFLVMFSKYGDNVRCIRYMTMVLFFGAILLCRNVDKIVEKCNLDFSYMKKNLFIGFLLCVLIDIRPAWKADSYQADYEVVFTEIADIIMERKLGNGVGLHWVANNITALMEGQYAVLEVNDLTEEGVNIGFNAPINYIVEVNGDYRWYSDEDIRLFLGEPDSVFETEDYQIYYYDNGIKVN